LVESGKAKMGRWRCSSHLSRNGKVVRGTMDVEDIDEKDTTGGQCWRRNERSCA
jgi:hypothetical protein